MSSTPGKSPAGWPKQGVQVTLIEKPQISGPDIGGWTRKFAPLWTVRWPKETTMQSQDEEPDAQECADECEAHCYGVRYHLIIP